MTKIIVMHDIVEKNGKTAKENNLEKTHKIKIGALVELKSGARLFIVKHLRDCDGTPLYGLTADLEEYDDFKDNEYWNKVHGGYGEDSLKACNGR